MKKISIVVPCYNEEENVVPISEAIVKQMESLPQYDYELVFIDNYSEDNTRKLIKEICEKNKKIKAIFNIKNFGQWNSPYYGICQSTGDCTILICADFQDPIGLIPVFLRYWEDGYPIVCGIKTSSQENQVMYQLRTFYYKVIKKISSVDQIEHFTGFGLYDKSFVNVLRQLKDPNPYLRGIVAELGGTRKEVQYEQAKRRAGKTHNNFYSLYDGAMLAVTSYTKIGMRLAVFVGLFFALFSLVVGSVYLILKLLYWDRFAAGNAPSIIIVSLLGSILLAFMGLLGEYISVINTRLMNRPLVVEEERINFGDSEI